MASMDAETTKYLGGDVEHTHLVKGLDYALLVKIREEERQQQLEVRPCVNAGAWSLVPGLTNRKRYQHAARIAGEES